MRLVFDRIRPRRPGPLEEAFDPDGVFNPEKVLPSGSRCFDMGAPSGSRRNLDMTPAVGVAGR